MAKKKWKAKPIKLNWTAYDLKRKGINFNAKAFFDCVGAFLFYSRITNRAARLKLKALDYRSPKNAPHRFSPATVNIFEV